MSATATARAQVQEILMENLGLVFETDAETTQEDVDTSLTILDALAAILGAGGSKALKARAEKAEKALKAAKAKATKAAKELKKLTAKCAKLETAAEEAPKKRKRKARKGPKVLSKYLKFSGATLGHLHATFPKGAEDVDPSKLNITGNLLIHKGEMTKTAEARWEEHGEAINTALGVDLEETSMEVEANTLFTILLELGMVMEKSGRPNHMAVVGLAWALIVNKTKGECDQLDEFIVANAPAEKPKPESEAEAESETESE